MGSPRRGVSIRSGLLSWGQQPGKDEKTLLDKRGIRIRDAQSSIWQVYVPHRQREVEKPGRVNNGGGAGFAIELWRVFSLRECRDLSHFGVGD